MGASGRLERAARRGGDGARTEKPGAAVARIGRQREPRVAVYVGQPPQHGGGGGEERRLLMRRGERRGPEPDERELGEPDRQLVAGVDRLQVAAQLLDGRT